MRSKFCFFVLFSQKNAHQCGKGLKPLVSADVRKKKQLSPLFQQTERKSKGAVPLFAPVRKRDFVSRSAHLKGRGCYRRNRVFAQ